MIALLQRVCSAQVDVPGATIGQIEQGLLVFLAVEQGDSEREADKLLQRILGYRIFPDDQEKMNKSLQDIHGGLLLVPQFTLAADTRKGARPSFTPAASPAESEKLFNYFSHQAKANFDNVETGRFGADMQVSLVNDGPVTFLLKVAPGQS